MAKRGISKTSGTHKRSSSAAGSYRGFSLQATRCLHYLLAAEPPDFVCVEVLEDVSSHSLDGKVTAEQSKSYISRNPLSDRAVELWKTLRNWTDAVSRDALDANRTVFALFAPKVKPGELARALDSADDVESIAAVISKITAFSREKGLAEWQEHAKVVASTEKKLLSAVIKNFTVDSPTGSPAKTLPPLLKAKLISSEVIDDALKWAHGWIKTAVDALLEDGKPAKVSYAEFHAALLEFAKSHDRLVVLRSYAGTPDTADIDNHLLSVSKVTSYRVQ